MLIRCLEEIAHHTFRESDELWRATESDMNSNLKYKQGTEKYAGIYMRVYWMKINELFTAFGKQTERR